MGHTMIGFVNYCPTINIIQELKSALILSFYKELKKKCCLNRGKAWFDFNFIYYFFSHAIVQVQE